MATVNFRLSKKAENAMLKSIAQKAGAKMRTIVTDLHTEILSRTPMNTGRTLGSWKASAGTPMSFDIASIYGNDYFSYDPERFAQTNNLPVGSEPGRGTFVDYSMKSVQEIPFEKKPYQIFYISNGASLDSIANSDLDQGPGSRATQLEYGNIAGYDLYGSTPDTPKFIFTPRGIGAMRLSVEKIRLKYGK